MTPLMDYIKLVHIKNPDASPIIAYCNHDFNSNAPTVILVNAYGMPINVMHPIISRLRILDFNTISWDCRGLPDTNFHVLNSCLSINEHYNDWCAVRDNFNLNNVSMIGWSTGAVVASFIACHDKKSLQSLVMLNGSFMHPNAKLTAFQSNLQSIMPKVALSRKVASILYKSVFSGSRSSIVNLLTKDISYKANEAMSVTLPQHKHLVQLLTKGPEEVFRYACLIKAFVKENPMEWLSRIDVPTFVFTCSEDITAHPQGSYDAAAEIAKSKMYEHESGTHTALYSDEDYINAVFVSLNLQQRMS